MKTGFRAFVVALSLTVVSAFPAFAASPDMNWNAFGALFRGETDPDQCSSTGKTVASVTHKVVNDDDSGVGGNNWALDHYSRLLTIVEVVAPASPGGPGVYCAVTQYFGAFVTFSGASPNNTGTIVAGLKGNFRGGYRTTNFTGVFSPSINITGNLGIFDYGCDGVSCSNVFDWTTAYFAGALVGYDYAFWGWMYAVSGHGAWINADFGNSGDIL